ncbi:MAG: hypothetical protein HDQ96_13260 [Lachnospiraceae bacterium]|nr:hypothetical protein [Lachnospiraceae bacterium]
METYELSKRNLVDIRVFNSERNDITPKCHTITSPEYLAARVYNVAVHPLQTLGRINVNGVEVPVIANKINNKEYDSLARGAGYIAGNIAQAYAISIGIEKCGELINKKRYGTGTFADGMSLEDAKAYLEIQDHRSKAGLTDAELLGIQKVDDYLALNKTNYDDLLALRRAEQAEYENFLKYGNVKGNIEPAKTDFIVTPNGTVMDTSIKVFK